MFGCPIGALCYRQSQLLFRVLSLSQAAGPVATTSLKLGTPKLNFPVVQSVGGTGWSTGGTHSKLLGVVLLLRDEMG